MKYWLTTHWPRREGEVAAPGGVWVEDGKEDVIAGVDAGDCVAIYESGSGKDLIDRRADGSETIVRSQVGRQGVIGIYQATAPAAEMKDSKPEQYSDRTTKWWRWYAPTKPLNTAGFVSRQELARILGFKENYPFRGAGDRRSGLKKITESEFLAIRRAFVASHDEADRSRVQRTKRTVFPADGGGEGPAHKSLKEAVAANPALLGESMSHIQTEFPFPTGDRIDILLKDDFGRFVAVEVELDCDEKEETGPLQCMKYRALTAYWFRRRVEEIRSVLVAHSIHADLIERLESYDVECRVIPRPVVSA